MEDGDQENKTLGEIIEKTNEENVKLWVQISAMKKELKALKNEKRTLQTKLETKAVVDPKIMLESSNEVSTSCDEKHKKELAQLEKEHSEIEDELQQWVEDENQKNKALEEFIETTNEENVKLLVQISVMKKELKALEKENNILQDELKTKRTDLKSLRVNEHYNERELRNLKRDLKRKELSLDNALAEKQELLDDIEYLEGSLTDIQAATELLNGKINELKDVVKELNKRPGHGHLREEVELFKGSLELFRGKEELLSSQVDTLKSELSHFKACELDLKKLQDETINDKKVTEAQEQVENLREQENLILSELDMAYHSLNLSDVVIENLMKDLECEMLETHVLSAAFEFSLDNCAIKEKAHANKNGSPEYQLQQLKFLLSIMDS